MSDDDKDHAVSPVSELMLAEARRALDSQVNALEGVRSRSNQLLGFAATAAALFTGLSAHRDWATWLGLAFLGAVAVLVIAILKPTKVHFDFRPKDIENGHKQFSESADHTIRSMAMSYSGNYERNELILDELHSLFFLALCAFGSEMAFLAVSVMIN